MKRRAASQTWRQWTVAITGVNARAESPGPGCAVARCLKEHSDFTGKVIALGYDILDAGLYDRELFDGGYLIPYPSAGQNDLLVRLLELHEQEHFDAIVPCLDAEILNFIAIEDELAQAGIKLCLPSKQQFLMRAKDRLVEFCQSTGVKVPRTKSIADARFFDSCQQDEWQYPLVVKGIFYDAYIANNPVEAKAAFNKMVAVWGYPVLVQEVIPGNEFNISGVGDGQGRLLSPVIMRKRALTDKGKAWAGITVSDPAMLETAEKLISGLKWRGPFEVEVMLSDEGDIYLIEMNPRFPAWIYLSHAAHRNLPIALLRLLAGESVLETAGAAQAGTMFIRYAREVILEIADLEKMIVHGGIGAEQASDVRSA